MSGAQVNAPLVIGTGAGGLTGMAIVARHARRVAHTTTTAELAVLAALGALLGALAPGAATGLRYPDIAFRAIVGLGFVLAAARSNPRARILASLVVALPATFALGSTAAVPAYAALGLAIGTKVTRWDSRTLAAVVGLAVGQAALRLSWPHTTGLSALCAFSALAILGISALGRIDTRLRRRLVRLLTSIVVAAMLVSAAYAVLVFIARRDIDNGIAAVRAAVAASREGNTAVAAGEFERARDAFDHARSLVDGTFTQPVRVVPITGKYAGALAVVTNSGMDLAATGASLSRNTDTRITLRNGRVQLDRVRGLQTPLTTASRTLKSVEKDLNQIDTTWLVSPLSDPIHRLNDRMQRARDDVNVGLLATRVVPALLGGDDVRHYFVAFQTPAEQRANGGIIGNYAEVTFAGGRFDLVRSGRDTDLNSRGNPRKLVASEEYAARYTKLWDPARFWQNVPTSPDLPTVARVVEGLYPQSGGHRLDGVVSVDPIALGALLELTGPVQVKDLPFPLTSQNAAQVLLHDQYVRFPRNNQRLDFLGEAIKAVINRLKHGDLPPPARIAKVLAPVIRQGRLKLHSVHADEEQFLERIGVAGQFPRPTADDFIGLVSQNASLNKIDIFQRRALDYRVDVDPVTGHVSATATITIYNDAPRSGLPGYVIGGVPVRLLTNGDSKSYVSLYSSLALRNATLNGAALKLDTATELGRNTFSTFVFVPSQGSAVLRMELEGQVTLRPTQPNGDSKEYRLVVWAQPTIRPDAIEVRVRGGRNAVLEPLEGLKRRHGELYDARPLSSTTTYAAEFSRR